MSDASLSRATLARQMLLAREKITAVRAIERIAGMQAQLARPPFVGLWTRITGFRREELARAIGKHEVVRGPFFRGTLHIVSAKDFVLFRALMQRALDTGMRAILKNRFDDLDRAAITAMARKFFLEPRTFDELRVVLEKAKAKDVRGQAFAARMFVPLMQVPSDDMWSYPNSARFTLAEPAVGVIAKDAGAKELVKRYLAAFGPASVTDAQTWSGIKDLAPTFAELRDELVVVESVGKRELFDLPKAPRPDEDEPAPPRFLPEFDNLLLAYANRKRFVADAHRKAIYLPGLRVAPTFLASGAVAGTWKVSRAKAAATLEIQPFSALAKKDKEALAAEGASLVRFIEPEASSFDVIVSRP